MSSTLKAGRTGSISTPPGLEDVPRLNTLDQVSALQRSIGPIYLRFSPGPAFDARSGSHDKESGCDLPGLTATPLTPEPWWDRPEDQWIARQMCQYRHLTLRSHNAGWLLTGDIVGRGADSEPLIASSRPVALLTQDCVEEAASVYEKAFPARRR